MMPNVVRGDRMGGLMVYLAGPGRSNEHTEPHMVAPTDRAHRATHPPQPVGHCSRRERRFLPGRQARGFHGGHLMNIHARPQSDQMARRELDPDQRSDLGIAVLLGGQQHDACPPCQPRRHVQDPNPRLQHRTI